MRWEDFRTSSNVEDRRGMGLPGGAGGLGIGTIVILGLIGWALGIDPRILIGGAEMMAGGNSSGYEQQQGRQGAPDDQAGRFASAILGNTEDVWKVVLPQQTGRQYDPPKMVLFSGATRSGCGGAQSAMGPFYCPLDEKVYIDLGFYDELQSKFGASGDFAQAYVIAHELGHHVQHVLGTDQQVRRAQQGDPSNANQYSVRLELQADCYAGVWGRSTQQRDKLDQGDIEEGMNAAASVGDDRILSRSGQRVSTESFTHGSSQQRMTWFRKGFETGDPRQCDTFAG
jgi:uncharacterized protein